MSEWISVKERCPPSDETVLVQDKKGIFTAHITGSAWICSCECFEGSFLDNVTHWMRLPEAPDE